MRRSQLSQPLFSLGKLKLAAKLIKRRRGKHSEELYSGTFVFRVQCCSCILGTMWEGREILVPAACLASVNARSAGLCISELGKRHLLRLLKRTKRRDAAPKTLMVKLWTQCSLNMVGFDSVRSKFHAICECMISKYKVGDVIKQQNMIRAVLS